LPTAINRPRVAHFCGGKPYMHDFQSYCAPFSIARIEHHRKTKGGGWGLVGSS
jgi:hypothetical protein